MVLFRFSSCYLCGNMLYAALLATFVTISARQLPSNYKKQGDVCREEGDAKWTFQDCHVRVPPRVDSCGNDTSCTPLVCCPPESVRVRRQEDQKPGVLANHFCEKYMESCGGIVGGKLSEVQYSPLIYSSAAGGVAVTGRSQPHMALIGYGPNKQWKCGGSLISERFVLTAAHCIPDIASGSVQWVRLGELDYSRSDDDASPEDFSISRVVVHPEYRSPTLYHDIALLELDRNVTFSPWIKPICLHTHPTVPFKSALASGWGRTGPVNPLSSQLMVINIGLVSKTKCRSLTKSSSKIPQGIADDGMICAGDLTGVQDTCQGDSGGPLFIKMSNRCLPSQIGITSFGALCTRPNSPGIYTQVYNYLQWIEQVVWGS